MSARRTIHLVNPLWNAAGGSEQHTLELYRELSPHADVHLWTEHLPDPDFASLPIQRIDAAAGRFPRGGTLVFVGVYELPGPWIANAVPRRTIVLYNMLLPRQLVACMRRLFNAGSKSLEVVFASEALKQQTKLRGIVEPSFIDLRRFCPANRPLSSDQRFTVGRLSRDDYRKHHPEDPEVYRRLTNNSCRVRIMGCQCLAASQALPEVIEVMPVKAEPAEQFLASLDCFYYRTGLKCWEAFGRVVHEAMACGLPVVCHNRGGYVTSIDHGRTGFLFETTDEAVTLINRLQTSPDLAQTLGQAARAAMEKLYSPAQRAKIIDYYLL